MSTDITSLVAHGAKSPKAMAQHYGVSRTWLFEQMKLGRLTAIRLSARKILLSTAEVGDLLAAAGHKGSTP
jgi:hypothetical protein